MMIPTSVLTRSVFRIGVGIFITVAFLDAGSVSAADPENDININRQVDYQTFENPNLDLPPATLTWPVDFRPAWRAALLHSESDLRSQTIASIRQAHRYGMPGLSDLEDALCTVLQDREATSAARAAAAAALVELDCRQAASLLFKQSSAGPLQLQVTVETGLAHWDYSPARDVWLARLNEQAAHYELVRVAMESLAKVRETRAVEPLSKVLLSPTSGSPLRLTAARALGTLAPIETLRWSEMLMSGVSPDSDLDAQLGVELLTKQSSPQAIELLKKYSKWPSASVASIALQRLVDLEPSFVLAGAAETLLDADANVRKVAVVALSNDPSIGSVELLTAALNDPVPDIRRDARLGLLRHASDDSLRPSVIRYTVQLFEADEWRALENAVIVLTELEHRQIKPRLISLIRHPRPEVHITAAWGLKHLAEAEDGPILLKLAQRVTNEVDRGGQASRSLVQTHLHEALGLVGYQPAIEHLAKLVPKSAPYEPLSRASSIWALGFLLKSPKDGALIKALESRLADDSITPAEYRDVRAAAAIALGRINAPDSLALLRTWNQTEGNNSSLGRSCGWAIMQMTGEPLPDAEASTRHLSGWFSEPLAPMQPTVETKR